MDSRVYTFDRLGPRRLTDCRPYWPQMPQAPYVRFAPSDTPFGEGVDDYRLVPYRSVAVDESRIPVGTALYIPAARGLWLTLPDGARVRHDGYFFAADDGYGIRGSHIDVFIGVSDQNPFPWVVSRPAGTFPAYVVTDPAIVRALRRRHLPPD
jgi:3D (Asp-Asp-Asp) domain-containing protein